MKKEDLEEFRKEEEELKEQGYIKYKLLNGDIWWSKGCPCCSKDKIKVINIE